MDSDRPDLIIGIIGAGLMGRGIAQIAALAGCTVLLQDVRPDAARAACAAVSDMFDKLVAKGKLAAGKRDEAAARLQVAESLAGLRDCHLVIEAIVENLGAKQDLLRQIETVVADDCLLATNTSSLSVTAIASVCRVPGRVAGFHFFSPVPLMRVVEVIDGLLTEAWVSEALTILARRLGHRPVRAKDTPGFIVNHAGRGFGTEALRILGEGVTEFATIDRVLREAAGFRMGPFELLDLTGLDVSHPVMESIYGQFYHEPRFRPSPITAQRLAGGLLGRKTNRGFYRYGEDGAPLTSPEIPAPQCRPASVWLETSAESGAVADLLARLCCEIESGTPSPQALCIVLPLGEDTTTASLRLGLDPTRTVALDPLFGLDTHRTVMVSPATSPETRDQAHGLLASDGVPVSVIRDSAGLIAQRIVACIVNIACEIAQQRIATPVDIDDAVTLGLGYPQGPLAWGDALGPGKIARILDRLLAITGDPRYRASLWLRRRALLGVSLHTLED